MQHQRTISNILSITTLAILILGGFAAASSAQDGNLDLSFSNDGKQRIIFDEGGNLRDVAAATAIQADGKILLAGFANTGDLDSDGAVARLQTDGYLDPTFSGDGKLIVDIGPSQDAFHAIAVQPDQKILLAGIKHFGVLDFDFFVARLNPDGSYDPGFGVNGFVTVAFDLGDTKADFLNAMALQPDGKIVLVGLVESFDNNNDIGIVRLNSDGSLDTSFSEDGKKTLLYNAGGDNDDIGEAVVIQNDGKIVIAATFDTAPGETDIGVFRLTPSGGTDSTFAGGGVQIAFDLVGANQGIDWVRALAIDSMGRIVVVGSAQVSGDDYDMAFARINPDGSMDTGFAYDGKRTVWFDDGGDYSDDAYDVAVLPDGKIVAVGGATVSTYSRDVALVRLESNGDLDTTFGTSGRVRLPFNHGGTHDDAAYGVVVQNDGNIVVGGSAAAGPSGGLDADFVAARLLSTQAQTTPIFVDGFESGDLSRWSLVSQ